jgi:hypothetical protein
VGGSSELADECEAFLEGRYARWSLYHQRVTPAWAWLNQAAHGPWATLLEEATRAPSPVLPDGWGAASHDIALAVVGAAADPAELGRLQHDVLVPLELDLARSEIDPALLPCELARLVSATVDAERAGAG